MSGLDRTPWIVALLAGLAALGCDCGSSAGGSGELGSAATGGREQEPTGEADDPPPEPEDERPPPAHLEAAPGRLAVTVRGGPQGDIEAGGAAEHPRSCWHFDRSEGATAIYLTTGQRDAASTDLSLTVRAKGAGRYRLGPDAEDARGDGWARLSDAQGTRWRIALRDVAVEFGSPEGEHRRLRATLQGQARIEPPAGDGAERDARLEAELEVPWGPCADARTPVRLAGWAGRGGEPLGELRFTEDGAERRWTFHASDVEGDDGESFAARPAPESSDELAIVIWSHRLETLDYPVTLPAPREGSAGRRGRQPRHSVEVTYARDGRVYTKRGAGADAIEVELTSFDPRTGRLEGRLEGPLGERGGDDTARIDDGRFHVQLAPARD